jgi:hypothetical protein
MAGLRDQFEFFYTPDDKATAAALRTGLVTPDTNVLLSLYRFQSEARDELFGALERVGDRLWVPYQVALEFHRNRLKVIADQESYFNKTRSDLQTAVNEYIARLRGFSARIALSKPDSQKLENKVRQAHAAVEAQVAAAEIANEVHLEKRNSDDVLERLEALLNDRVGASMSPDELKAAKAEAKKRADDSIPPGYAEKGKSDASGDYIIWKQFIHEAKARKLPTVFITDDRKEDWYWREHGLTLGARYELRKEMEDEAGVPLFMMTSDTFLVHARNYLEASVSPATVDQAKELRDRAEWERFDRRIAVQQGFLEELMDRRYRLDSRVAEMTGRIERMQRDRERGVTEYGAPLPDNFTQEYDAVREELDRLSAQRDSLTRDSHAARDTLARLEVEMDTFSGVTGHADLESHQRRPRVLGGPSIRQAHEGSSSCPVPVNDLESPLKCNAPVRRHSRSFRDSFVRRFNRHVSLIWLRYKIRCWLIPFDLQGVIEHALDHLSGYSRDRFTVAISGSIADVLTPPPSSRQ